MITTSPQLLAIEAHTLAAQGFNEDQPNTPIVFIHGITSSLNFWVPSQTAAIAKRRWYTLSLPGHYPAAFPPGFAPEALTAELIADLTSAALKQLVGDQSVILAGHSTGGFTALATAARHPEQIQAAVSISGFAHGYWTGVLRLLQMEARGGWPGQQLFKGMLHMLTASYPLYRSSLRFYAADVPAVYHDAQLESVLDDLYADATHLSVDAMLAYFNRMPDIDITTWLPDIQAPTLVTAGTHDPIVPPDQARLIAQAVPHSTLHLFEGAGHLPMSERAPEYHRVIGDWITAQL